MATVTRGAVFDSGAALLQCSSVALSAVSATSALANKETGSSEFGVAIDPPVESLSTKEANEY